MALSNGIYRISKWEHNELPECLTIIDGKVSIAVPDVGNVRDQEVICRFLANLYSVSYQLSSGASRPKRTAT